MKKAFKVSLLALALLSAHAQAAEYRLDGATFDIVFRNDSAFGLFGTPTLAGNTLFFTPDQYSAKSTTKQWDINNSTISFWIEADAGHHLAGASLLEQGDYSLFGKSAFASVAGQTRSVDIRKSGESEAVDFTGGKNLATTPIGETTNWEVTSLQTFATDASKVKFSIENLLFANGGSKGGYAFVEKKYVGLTVSTVPELTVSAVPEPESFAMLLAGLGLIGAIAHRRRMPTQ
jgi:hypothetical protein